MPKFLILKLWSKSSSESLNLNQKSVVKPAFCPKKKKKLVQQAKLSTDLFYKPPFLALWVANPYPNLGMMLQKDTIGFLFNLLVKVSMKLIIHRCLVYMFIDDSHNFRVTLEYQYSHTTCREQGTVSGIGDQLVVGDKRPYQLNRNISYYLVNLYDHDYTKALHNVDIFSTVHFWHIGQNITWDWCVFEHCTYSKTIWQNLHG